eukprot:3738661-Heterocapsa_arctica.AAC.1
MALAEVPGTRRRAMPWGLILRVRRAKSIREAETTNPDLRRPHVVEKRGEVSGTSSVSGVARVVVDNALH